MTETLSGEPVVLGVVGGGQLGRMLAEAASPLGVEVVVLDPTPDCPASAVADQIEGAFDDADAVAALAARADALTYEIELAAPGALREAAADAGVEVHPRPATLELIEDKLRQKRAFADAGIPVPEFRGVDTEAELEAALDDLGRPAMLKARTGGYDGRGNTPVSGPDDAAPVGVGGTMVEEFVDFARELSVIGVKGDGETAAFPVVENVHEAEILRETIAPARTSDGVRERALDVVDEVLDVMEGRGVYGIELFETRDGEILVNEVAPRPHNSGHYTIEGALTSQFEQHVRAVLGWPLGATDLRDATAMANVLGDVEESRPAELSGVGRALAAPGVSMHWYGKREVRPLRKMGHVTGVAREGEAPADVLDRVRELRDGLTFNHD
ncbi:MAG: 5-(carboxyamino)imidazole ribonucleotide synthase [Halobacteriaceae archaeon]